MNSNQRSQGNNQSDNGANEQSVSSSRSGTVEKDNINQPGKQNQQSGTLGEGSRQGQEGGQNSTDRAGSQTGNQAGKQQQGSQQQGSQQQGNPAERQPNDVAGGLPKSPGGKRLSADQDMDDDTGLSNRGNRQSADEIDDGTRQSEQSNVGRRSDGTPD